MYILKYTFETFFFLILLLTPILAEWNTKDYIRREHSLTKPYQGEWPDHWLWTKVFTNNKINWLISGSGMSVPYWDFLGNTIVTTNYVRLTPDLQSKSGAIWNTAVSVDSCYKLTNVTKHWFAYNLISSLIK